MRKELVIRHSSVVGIAVAVLLVAALTSLVWGGFFMLLPDADERFDAYSTARRRSSKRAGPWMVSGGAVLLVVVGLFAFIG